MNKNDLNKFSPELHKVMVPNWRPVDAMRLRLSGLVQPTNKNKLSINEKHNPNAAELELYKLVRSVRPKIIVETGVQNGCTTELILGALKINDNQGQLLSFDCGSEYGDICTDKTWDGVPGQYIQKQFKDKWGLILGISTNIMKEYCEILPGLIDIFHHDSDHETAYINQELEIIYPFMRSGGLICMHDAYERTFTLEQSGRMKKIYDENQFTIWEINKK